MYFHLENEKATAFFAVCKKRHDDELNKADPDYISIPKILIEKLKLIDRKIVKKVRTGKTVIN